MVFSLIRHSQRGFTTAFAPQERFQTIVPGLVIYRNFLGKKLPEMTEKAVDLHLNIAEDLKRSHGEIRKTHVSKQHNISSERSYQLVKVREAAGKVLQGQHFLDYGDLGHTLTYFIGNGNIPDFIKEELILRIQEIAEVKALGEVEKLNWRFTFNAYKAGNQKLSGFAFHKDIASNGIITLIYSIGARSLFQIRLPGEPLTTQAFPLVSDSLVLLSGEARWNFEHSVIPVDIRSDSLLDRRVKEIRRFSLVLGCA